MMSPGKHGRIIMEKYHARGKPCPVAVAVGMHPAYLMIAGLEIPYGKNEYEAVGGLLGEPVEIINMPRTGLPVPANAEIAFEGLIHPDDKVLEGPLGEWTGYYAGGQREEPAIRIETLMHRRCRRTTTRSISAPTAAARCGASSRPPAFRACRACGRTRPAAAASG
jgi:4-hydroxy-3-polyprenylbenzoate decarboxylase